MYSHDIGGIILWIPLLILAGIVYAVRVALKKFGVKTGEWSSFELVWYGIEMILGIALATGLILAFTYGGINLFPKELEKLLNSESDIQWLSIIGGAVFWYLIIGSLALWIWNIITLIRLKLKKRSE
jgi:hypothetical protein